MKFSIMSIDHFGEKDPNVWVFLNLQEAKDFFGSFLENERENSTYYKVSTADKIKTPQNLVKNLNKAAKNKMSSKNIQARFEYFLGDLNE